MSSPLAFRLTESPALLTDLYQLTMGYAHHRAGTTEQRASFALYFRKAPFGGRFAVAAGIEETLAILAELRFEASDLAYLATLTGADGVRLFDDAFLARLGAFRFRGDVDAVPEGTLVLPHVPMMRLTGPVMDVQIAETVLLNTVNFQTLIATKAARIVRAAMGRPVVEFGLRRAQGADGGLAASRAAYVGGCAGTSNVLAGKLFGIPVRGTHAHAWVQFFGDEEEAFARYIDALPGNVVLLVDTYETELGVDHAIAVGRCLRERGKELLGIRLDSGDMDSLARIARAKFDAAGLPDVKIYASNDLDEYAIEKLMQQGAPIDVFGVGTRLVTGGDQSALGGVYKLQAVEVNGVFQPRMKHSEEPAKASIPGRLGVTRCAHAKGWVDVLYDMDVDAIGSDALVDARTGAPLGVEVDWSAGASLLQPMMRGGDRVMMETRASEVRQRVRASIASSEDALFGDGTLAVAMPRALWDRRATLLSAVHRANVKQTKERA